MRAILTGGLIGIAACVLQCPVLPCREPEVFRCMESERTVGLVNQTAAQKSNAAEKEDIMSTGKVQVYYGAGKGKTSAALGYAIHEASRGESVIVIQFLKRKDEDEISFIGRLEPEIRLFRFQKSEKFYDELPEEEQQDERMNMQNGIDYARKVLQTGECNILILDEVLGLLDEEIVTEEELIRLIRVKSEETHLILTGRVISDGILDCADEVYEICIKKDAQEG